MSLQTRGKRKKSGAEYRRLKLARIDEQEKLSSFMEDFLKNSARVPHDDIGEPIASNNLILNGLKARLRIVLRSAIAAQHR